MENKFTFSTEYIQKIKSLQGPIMIFGAGGFIGINLLKSFLQYRDDVYGISQDHFNNWRFIANKIPHNNLRSCDLNQSQQIRNIIKEIRPNTIFNLAAYGAYSKQDEYEKIYRTNFIGSVDLIEILKEQGFKAYIQAGSSSEYGLNSAAPDEKSELIPNSHYAVSKTAIYHAIKYYGKFEKLPVAHLRLYSVYGPWEEPDRLLPVMINHARQGKFPPLVHKNISRDFIHIQDVTKAFIELAFQMNESLYGEVFNIGTGKKTSIGELTQLVKSICQIEKDPEFGIMDDRKWDMEDWFAKVEKSENLLNWKSEITLEDGLKNIIDWQNEIDFNNVFWNWKRL
jgi:dolichol-phosphate mannosyltransferase